MFGKFAFIGAVIVVLLSSPAYSADRPKGKELNIVWQRLVDQKNQTCPRCRETGDEVRQAVKKLQRACLPLGVSVVLQTKKISPEEFNKAPLASNRIAINGKTVEEWLGGVSGQSKCCDSCGTNDCRTVKVDGKEFEAVPERLIIKAGLTALANLY